MHHFTIMYFHYPIFRPGFAGAFCYEALRVPPLLPEYLGHPVNIIIQAGSSDWTAPLLSLGGVALGAGLAYLSSKSLDRTRIKLEKIEEIVCLSSELEKNFLKYAKGFLAELYETESGEVHRQASSGPEVHDLNRQVERLDFIMMVHLPGRDDLRKRFRERIISAGLEITLIGGSPNVEASKVDDIHRRMQSELAHITFAQKDIQSAAIIDSKKLLRTNSRWRAMLAKLRISSN